jgi:hypothetical protein
MREWATFDFFKKENKIVSERKLQILSFRPKGEICWPNVAIRFLLAVEMTEKEGFRSDTN